MLRYLRNFQLIFYPDYQDIINLSSYHLHNTSELLPLHLENNIKITNKLKKVFSHLENANLSELLKFLNPSIINFSFSYDYLNVKYPLFGQRYYGIPIIHVIFLLAKISSFHKSKKINSAKKIWSYKGITQDGDMINECAWFKTKHLPQSDLIVIQVELVEWGYNYEKKRLKMS
ncbi:unnamed protein product [Rhizophagus irregularis]|nr:unnamed protein product [Rhizophagus irregularis]